MPRLSELVDRGPVLRVRQTNTEDGEVYAVAEADFIEGAYDPDHYEILGYGESADRPEIDADGNAVANEDGTPKMVREYRPLEKADHDRIVKAAAAERKAAASEAKAANPEAFRAARSAGSDSE